ELARRRDGRRHARPAAQVPRRHRAHPRPRRRSAPRRVAVKLNGTAVHGDGGRRGPGVPPDIVGFVRALREAGLRVGVDQTESFAQALAWVDPLARRDVYLAARATLVFRREDLAIFDELFATFFGGPRPVRPAVPQATP